LPALSIYLKHEVSIKELGDLSNRYVFIGIDLAPIDTLETGVCVLDQNRTVIKTDKLGGDHEIFRFLAGYAENPQDIIIALDVPKSLSIQSKWRQQEIKMHPLRLESREGEEPIDRFAPRAREFYRRAQEQGYLIFNIFSPHTKLRYDLDIPYKNRTPQGCRALQALIKQRLMLDNLSANLSPSSVLDAMIGSYTAWALWRGKDGEDFKLYRDEDRRLYFDPLKRV